MDNAISAEGCQRISEYRTVSHPKSDRIQLICEVVKLHNSEITLKENVDIPFENDDSIVGKWEIIGEFAVKEDFFESLPEGKREMFSLFVKTPSSELREFRSRASDMLDALCRWIYANTDISESH